MTLLASMAASACGGGGGGSAEPSGTDAQAAATATAPPAPTVRNVALWGDSLTGPVALNLGLLARDRQMFNGGVIGETSSEIASRVLADTSHRDWISVFWLGHNNQTEAAQIKADIAACVAHLVEGNSHFVVMSVVNQATWKEQKGGPDYGTILRLNEELAAQYPGNFIDIRSHLVSQFNPALAQDVTDHGNDVPPASLRFDEIHLNNDGSIVVARRLKAFIDAQGW